MKAIVSILLLTFSLYASQEREAIKAKILEKIFKNISIKKELILWSDNPNLLLELKKNADFTTSSNCNDATMLILEKNILDKSCKNKAVFVLKYNLLNELSQSFGALFWKKGRPNIIIISPRAKKHSIDVSENLSDYLEDRVW